MDQDRSRQIHDTNKKELEALQAQGYTIGSCFQEGQFSKICKAVYKEPEDKANAGTALHEPVPLVCKIIRKDSLPHLYARKLLPMQLEILSRLTHAHIVSLHSILASEFRYFLFLGPCELGNLFDFLRRHGSLSPDHAKYWFRQLVEAVVHCHSNGISHRNLTVRNILITGTRDVRLTGFDFATLFSRQVLNRTTCGSTYYVPPEILAGIPYDSTKGDVWCLGVILIYMMTRVYPFPATKPSKLLKQHHAGLRRSEVWPTASKSLPKECLGLILNCFNLKPAQRPTAKEVLSHAWLKQEDTAVQLELPRPTVYVPPGDDFKEKEVKMSMTLAAGIVHQIHQLNPRKSTLLINALKKKK